MQLNIHNIYGSIAATIEEKASESDVIASGVIGPSFATSGPGAGWSRHYDVHDYARRALDEYFGALSYIDSSDGREATLSDDGSVVWSEESVVEIELPTVEEALADPDTWDIIRREASDYGVDQDEIDELTEKIEATKAETK